MHSFRSHFARLSIVAVLALAASACDDPKTLNTGANAAGSAGLTGMAVNAPAAVPSSSTRAVQAAKQRSFKTEAMIFNGDGTWATEVTNLQNILNAHHATFRLVDSAELNGMSVSDLEQFGVLIFPGGAGGTEAGNLTTQTKANLRTAVQQGGLSYVGFCAGSFIAEAPAPGTNRDVPYGIGVVVGQVLDYYYLENQGIDIAMTKETFADGSTADLLWYGGPVTPNTGVIARYPDGNPAISEMWSGSGFVILSGVHPSASEATLSSLGLSSTDGAHQDIAWKLIGAALAQQMLPHF